MRDLIRWHQPAVMRARARGKHIIQRNAFEEVVLIVSLPALVVNLQDQGWNAQELPADVLHVVRVSGDIETATKAQLLACDIGHLSPPLRHDVRTFLTIQGACP